VLEQGSCDSPKNHVEYELQNYQYQYSTAA
jgi:hypothetical protein